MNDSSGDKLFAARIEDMYRQCGRNYSPVFSSFLDERQCAEAERICGSGHGELLSQLWGGYEDAQRKMLCVYNEYCEDFIREEFPMKCLTFRFRKEDRLTHRDFLGSFMALRLKREVIGDIIIAEGIAQAFVTEVAAKLISSSVSKIGRVGVKISDSEPFALEVKQEFEEFGGTVASMRLDCVVGLACKVSRENAARLIRSEKVSVNHFPVISVSEELHGGEVLSVRGCGKFLLSEIRGTTKKGRIHIVLRKYK
ncbi:MAG: RNA-binding protein [Ruminococcus sp.]|nr:RNA-binding protein [Ruminococcus sp.]